MSWSVEKQYVDKRLGMHIIHLLEPDSGAKHLLQIVIGHDHCATCGAAKAKDNLGDIDPKSHTERMLDELGKSHAQMDEYAKKHRVPVKKI